MATDAETLALYEAARNEVLANGFSIGVDGQEWRRDNLDVLEKYIAHYRQLVAQAGSTTGGNLFNRSMLGIPSRG